VDQLVVKRPAHELVYQRLREMILSGDLAPGQQVTILGLTEDLGAGMTPVREAIRRLTAEGALQAHGNRRVGVPVLDAGQFDQIAFARLALEPELAERAGNHLTRKDIDEIERCDDAVQSGGWRPADVAGYLRGNYGFHLTLYAHADAPVLLGLVNTLWLRFGPPSRVVCGRFGTMNLPDLHEEALAAMRANDPAALRVAVERDIAQGIDLIRSSLESGKI